MNTPSRHAIVADNVFDGITVRHNSAVVIEGQQIVGVAARRGLPEDLPVKELPEGAWVAPGFIDVQVNGGGDLLFNTETTPLQTGQPAKCFNVAAGVYPIRWHYTMDNTVAQDNSLRIAYCFGGAAACVPTSALSSRLLRTTYP